MNPEHAALLARLDGSGSDQEWQAIDRLHSELGVKLPTLLLSMFDRAKRWQVRSSCVYHATKYARQSEAARVLALKGAKDRSAVVRYRGCVALAYSLDESLLPELRELAADVQNPSRTDILAVIDAIEHRNHNYFVDRKHTGDITLNIG
jgi:hypothetical protein